MYAEVDIAVAAQWEDTRTVWVHTPVAQTWVVHLSVLPQLVYVLCFVVTLGASMYWAATVLLPDVLGQCVQAKAIDVAQPARQKFVKVVLV